MIEVEFVSYETRQWVILMGRRAEKQTSTFQTDRESGAGATDSYRNPELELIPWSLFE